MWMTIIRKVIDNFVLPKELVPRTQNGVTEPKVWRPSKFLNSTTTTAECSDDKKGKYALVVLNRPINLTLTHTKLLWERAKHRCLVDGGANRWLNFLETHPEFGDLECPELLTGDFDSITEHTMSHFKASTTKIIHTPNQNYTDFTKSLMELSPHIIEDNIASVVVLLDTSGRIDHIFAHISTLVRAQVFLENVSIFILSRDSISWLLNAGKHTIHVPQTFVDKQLWCSFVPIDGKCSVSTTGLKWNLDNQFVQFGGIVSTSNTYSSNVVTVMSDGFLYWSMGITEEES